MVSATKVPTISSLVHPKSTSAAAFHSTTTPPRSISTKASGHPARSRSRRRSWPTPDRARVGAASGTHRATVVIGHRGWARVPPQQPSQFVDHRCALQPASAAGPRGRGGVSGQSRHGAAPIQGFPRRGVPAGTWVDGGRPPPGSAVYRACRGRGHRHRAEAGMGGEGPATGRGGPAGAVVHSGPIPDNPLRYVLVYALELDGGGVAIVDAGWDTDEAWYALLRGRRRGGQHQRRPGRAGHPHPPRPLRAGRSGARGLGSVDRPPPARRRLLESRYGDTDELLDAMFHFLADSGVPDEKLPDLAFASMVLKSMVTMAEPDVLFEDQKEIDLPGWRLRTIWTPGHSPGHVCFHSDDQRLLLSGDHILPRITPNISVHAQQFPNPLGDYPRVAGSRSTTSAPMRCSRPMSTGSPTSPVRIDEIIAHHADRLEEIVEVIRVHPGVDAWEITLGSTGPARGTRSNRSCNARPTARPWPTASCSNCTTGSGGSETPRPGSSWWRRSGTRSRPTGTPSTAHPGSNASDRHAGHPGGSWSPAWSSLRPGGSSSTSRPRPVPPRPSPTHVRLRRRVDPRRSNAAAGTQAPSHRHRPLRSRLLEAGLEPWQLASPCPARRSSPPGTGSPCSGARPVPGLAGHRLRPSNPVQRGHHRRRDVTCGRPRWRRGHPGLTTFVLGGGSPDTVATVQPWPRPRADPPTRPVSHHHRFGGRGQLPPTPFRPGGSPPSAVRTLARPPTWSAATTGTTYLPPVLATTDGTHYSTVATSNVPVRYPAVVSHWRMLYAFGGQTASTGSAVAATDDVQVIDPASHTTDRGRPPAARPLRSVGVRHRRDDLRGRRPGARGTDAHPDLRLRPLDRQAAPRRTPAPGRCLRRLHHRRHRTLGGRLHGGRRGRRPVRAPTRPASPRAPSSRCISLRPSPYGGPAGVPGAGAPYTGTLLIADRGNDRLIAMDTSPQHHLAVPVGHHAATAGRLLLPR